MWPMMAGAALQYGSGLDQANATQRAMGQFQYDQNNLNNNLAADYASATPEMHNLSNQWKGNLTGLIGKAGGMPEFAQGQGAAAGSMNDAVAQARQMGAGYGTQDYNQGDTANTQVQAQAGAYNDKMLQDQIAQQAVGGGQDAMRFGQGQAMMQYGQQESGVNHGMNDLFNRLMLQRGLYDNLTQENMNRGANNMRGAAGVGRTGMEVGQGLQLAGMAYGSGAFGGGGGSGAGGGRSQSAIGYGQTNPQTNMGF